jgi:CRISPR/Cas system CMR subunit Cmr6 (Cas7 group RAMP superfamily)
MQGKILEAKNQDWFNPSPVTLLIRNAFGWRIVGRYKSIERAKQVAKKQGIKVDK